MSIKHDAAIKFLVDFSLYFEKRALSTSEDMTFQSCQNNARICLEIADLIKEIKS